MGGGSRKSRVEVGRLSVEVGVQFFGGKAAQEKRTFLSFCF